MENFFLQIFWKKILGNFYFEFIWNFFFQIRQHGIRLAEDGGFLVGNSRRPMNGRDPRDRQIAEEDAILMRHLTLEAQREFLMRRGFSPSHPYIKGEVPIHPELQGRLPFNVPSR